MADSQTIHYINEISHDSKVQREKINYFVDCLDLYTHSLSFPLGTIKTDARLISRAIRQLLDSSNDRKFDNINHYYFHYKELLNPETIINEKYRVLLTALNEQLTVLESLPFKGKKAFDPTTLDSVLSELLQEFEDSYLKNVVEELRIAVFCKEDIHQHNHKAVIEECSKIIIAEFFNIGYTKDKIQKVFNEAITYRYENFDSLYHSEVLRIPVPPEIHALQRTKSRTVYRNRVKKHLATSNLETQFRNLYYIFLQAQRERSFVFKIRNLNIQENMSLVLDGVTFSKSVKDKYIDKYSNANYKRFYNEEPGISFCEVSIMSGHLTDAFQKANIKVQNCLNSIQYEVSPSNDDRLSKAHLDRSEYVSVDLSTTLHGRNEDVRIKKSDIEHLKYMSELEALSNHSTVANYLKLDKIFFEAYSSPDRAGSLSSLWRYCEALFDSESGSHVMVQRLVNYYCSKAPNHIYLGVQQMIYLFYGRYYHATDEKIKTLGITPDELRLIGSKAQNITNYVNDLNAIIKHPVINRLKATADRYNHEEALSVINRHYYKVLKGANITRNLYQHSNLSIDEITNLWYEETLNFVGSLRWFIIADLKDNPRIMKIENLFPPFVIGQPIP